MTFSGGYADANAPSSNKCHVFDVAGAGLTLKSMPSDFKDTGPLFYEGKYSFIQGSEWAGNGTTCGSAACSDLIMLGSFLNEQICNKINDILGYQTNLEDSDLGGGQFTGTYAYGNTIANEAGGTNANSRKAACFLRTSDSTYIFTQLLISR